MDTAYNWTKKRIFVYGDWAAGALAVGLGVVPFVLGLASLVRARGEARTLELRVFRSVATAAVIGFGLYTGMKAAYLSQVFASRVEERNLIYISPVLFIGTALVLERRRVNLLALAGAAAYAIYVVVGTPLFIGNVLYSDSLGLAILQQANRYYLLSDGTAQWILIGAALFGVAAALVLTRSSRAIGLPLAVLVGVLVLAWNVTAEISAAAGNVTTSRELVPTLGRPFTWVDDATHLKPTLYLAQSVADQNPEWLLEFWNRSITGVSSLDGSVKGPGPAGAPNVTDRGQLYWTSTPSDPGKLFDYAVEDWPCIDFAGTFTASHFYRGGATQPRQWRLIRLTKPNRLRAMCAGIYGDGWSGEQDSTYFRFVGDRPGWLKIRMTRQGVGSPVDVRLGTITERLKEPSFGRTLRHVRTTIRPNRTVVEWVRTPPAPFAVHTVIAKKFSPGNGDVRQLGALITYHWYGKKP
jgi:hypothetical protein